MRDSCKRQVRVMHWAPQPWLAHARSMRSRVQAPYISREHLPLPPMQLRLALVAAQMLAYHERFRPTAAELQLYKAAVAAAGVGLGAACRRNAMVEFVAAAREAHEVATEPPAPAAAAGGSREAAAEGTGATDDDIVDEVWPAIVSCVRAESVRSRAGTTLLLR